MNYFFLTMTDAVVSEITLYSIHWDYGYTEATEICGMVGGNDEVHAFPLSTQVI